jgi:hypothetical protein
MQAAAVPKKRCHKQRIDHLDIDGLHRSNALRRLKLGKGVHHEGRESEEDSGYQPAAQC